MTETARRLHRLGAPHARARALAVMLAGLGVALAAAALGLVLAPAVPGVTLSWVLIALSVAAAVWAVLRVRREAAAAPIGRLVESATLFFAVGRFFAITFISFPFLFLSPAWRSPHSERPALKMSSFLPSSR